MQADAGPLVSVLLPFHNAAQTIGDCVESILAQTLTDFEVIAVDDCSNDDSAQILRDFDEPRIKIIASSQRGLVPALNTGLAHCRAPLVARMDADDIMHAHRLEKQYRYLRQHHDVVLLATQVNKFPQASIRNGYREYMRWQNAVLSDEDIRNQIYIESPFAHPSVMFRRDSIIAAGAYRQGEFPEDYELWLRLMHLGHRMEKLDEVLLDWRESDDRLSRVSANYSRIAFDRTRAEYLSQDWRLRSSRPIAFWGAGRKTRQRARHLLDKGYEPLVWIDIDPKKIGNRINGIDVVEPAWLQQTDKDKPFVLNYVTNHGARDIARTYLHRIGYVMGQDYLEVG